MYCDREQSDDQSSETETRSLPPDSLAPDGLVPGNILAERFSPDKMPQLTQDQQKALQGGLFYGSFVIGVAYACLSVYH